MLQPVLTKDFKKQYRKLPKSTRQKFQKQLRFLLKDFRHPSLRSRKMEGLERFEARIDRRYRFTYMVVGEEVWLLSIGLHDKGLGKK